MDPMMKAAMVQESLAPPAVGSKVPSGGGVPSGPAAPAAAAAPLDPVAVLQSLPPEALQALMDILMQLQGGGAAAPAAPMPGG